MPRGSFFTRIEKAFIDMWWVIVGILLCYAAYEQGKHQTRLKMYSMKASIAKLQSEKEKALAQQEYLRLQIQSQGDYEWLELTLMRGLGQVPKEQRKIVFYPST